MKSLLFRPLSLFSSFSLSLFTSWHRRRIGTEAKAKVVASILGGKFVQFLAALYCFASVDLEETVEFKKFNKFCPQIDETTFALASLSILLLCVMRLGIPSCFGDANK